MRTHCAATVADFAAFAFYLKRRDAVLGKAAKAGRLSLIIVMGLLRILRLTRQWPMAAEIQFACVCVCVCV